MAVSARRPAVARAGSGRIVRLASVDSTQAVAFAMAERGAPDTSVVVADTQTRGRGRRGRVWHDEPGACLLASVLLRPHLAPGALPQLSLAAAVAVAEALERVAGVRPRLKWPNDVLVGGRKIAGILLECRQGAAPVVVVGIGINVAQRQFPAAIARRATSVALETGAPADRETLLGAVVERLAAWRARLEAEGFEPLRARWLALTDMVGRRVEVDGRAGTAVDLDGNGALILVDAGERWRVVAGEVEDGG